MKFKKYFFENFSSDIPFDIKNPRYVLSLDGVDSIFEKLIVNRPYSLTVEDFDDIVLVRSLLHVEVLQQKNGKLGIGVPFFVDEDATVLKELSKRVANSIVAELLIHKEQIFSIVECINNGYPAERNLYHILCGHIFDGLMFDYLEENKVLKVSQYMELTGQAHTTAACELRAFSRDASSGIVSVGRGSTVVYIKGV